MKKLPDTLSMLNLKAFNLAQQLLISSLIEEIKWLKERVERLEEREGEHADED